MIHLDYRDCRPIYAQIMDGLRQQIRTGVLLPGEKLPSVRELAAQLSINPNTIQRSYRELERSGWIISIPGKGTFVCEAKHHSSEDLEELTERFDETARKLLAMGVPTVELIARLTQMRGDNECWKSNT